jgi:hypothetical protein
MRLSGPLMLVGALCFTAASVDAAQGRGRGSTGTAGETHAQGPATQGRGPKADRSRGPDAERPDRPEHPGKGPHANEDATIAANIARNPELESRVKGMLPSGMTMEEAAKGFRNQGQFIAALNASKNQNIPFADLKAAMTTGEHPLSLGDAVQKLRPERPASTERPEGTEPTK